MYKLSKNISFQTSENGTKYQKYHFKNNILELFLPLNVLFFLFAVIFIVKLGPLKLQKKYQV